MPNGHWTLSGSMRTVLIPEEIDLHEFQRSMIVGLYWLTKREWATLKLLASGKTRKEIHCKFFLTKN